MGIAETKGPIYYWQYNPPPARKPTTRLIALTGLAVLALFLVIIWIPLLKPQTRPARLPSPTPIAAQAPLPNKPSSIVEAVSAALLFSTPTPAPNSTPNSGKPPVPPKPATPPKNTPTLPPPTPKGT